jgi:hypothetical protein
VLRRATKSGSFPALARPGRFTIAIVAGGEDRDPLYRTRVQWLGAAHVPGIAPEENLVAGS